MSNLSGFLMMNRLILACAAYHQVLADRLRWHPFAKAFMLPAALAISLTQGNVVHAVQSGGEYEAMLPPYCQGGKRFYHYCESLMSLYRAESTFGPSGARQKKAREAIGGIEYTLRYLLKDQPNHPAIPDVRLSLAKALFLSDEHGRAITEAQKVVESKPNHVQAYSLLIDIYVKLNAKGKALKAAEEGLRHLPDSKRLQRSYLGLGGKKPFPAPLVAAPREAEAAPSLEAIAPDTPADASGPTAAPSAVDSKATPVTSEITPPSSSEELKQKNPWCRFCP